MVPYIAACVVGSVVFSTVGALSGMVAFSESLLVVIVVNIFSLFAELAFSVVVELIMMASAGLASDLAVRVDLVTKFPAVGTLDEVDLLSPLGEMML